MKLWAGRFTKQTDEKVNDFNSSISFDARMYREDIAGSIAHATMLGECGILSAKDSALIVKTLKELLADIEAGKVSFSVDAEDIHMNIESMLTERIGDVGKRLHTARSRNDQVALDIRLYLRGQIVQIITMLLQLEKVLLEKAKANTETIMPGYTHLQRGQPTTFAHHMMAYAQMFRRDIGRLHDCLERMNECPLGAGAMATTTHPINRARAAELLGFRCATQNSMDSVSDRDFIIELLSAISLIMMHLSRFSEEVILWCSWEFKFIELDDAFSTGSSIMPQKKNPDVAELVRGKTGRVYGALMSLLTVMKGTPLAYNKDMQEDKQAVFDAVDTVKMCLSVFTAMFESATLYPQHMERAAKAGFINATDCADYLAKKGVPFRDAYKATGALVGYCVEQGKYLDTLSLTEFRQFHPAFDEDIYEAISLSACVNGRDVDGGPGKAAMAKQIAALAAFIEKEEKDL